MEIKCHCNSFFLFLTVSLKVYSLLLGNELLLRRQIFVKEGEP